MKGASGSTTTLLSLGVVAIACLFTWTFKRRTQRTLAKYASIELELRQERIMRQADRTGRTRAERLLRTRLLHQNPAGTSSLTPIAFAHSIFKDRRGTPRQGVLVPHSRARLKFSPRIQASQLMDGIEAFSHVWVIWVFHENTDVVKTSQLNDASNNSCINSDSMYCKKAKVRPPRLNGRKVGVLATRTPHRPNPLGLSLAQIEGIDDDSLWLSGVDFVDGTPILDVKPYVARYDSLPHAVSPSWIDAEVNEFAAVIFSSCADETIERHIDEYAEFYESVSHVKAVFTEVLRRDIRSLNQRRMSSSTLSSRMYCVRIDCFTADYHVDNNETVFIDTIRLDVVHRENIPDEWSANNTEV